MEEIIRIEKLKGIEAEIVNVIMKEKGQVLVTEKRKSIERERINQTQDPDLVPAEKRRVEELQATKEEP